MNVSSQKTGSKVNGLEQPLNLGGFTVSNLTFQDMWEVLEKCLQLEAHETSSF